MALILSGSVDVGGSMTATTILVSAPGGGGMISSSQQIQNYNLFAVTSSANTFYGSQTLSGSLAVTGTTSIGTTDTSYKLNVGGGLQLIDNSPSIRLRYSSGASISDIDIANNYDTFALQFYGNTTMDNYILFHNETSGYTMFQTAGTERVRINSTGLGVGKTPTSKLDVDGETRITGSLRKTGTGTTAYSYFSGNAGSGGSTNPTYTEGMALSWNNTNAGGESRLTFSNQGGGNDVRFGVWYNDNVAYREVFRIYPTEVQVSGSMFVGWGIPNSGGSRALTINGSSGTGNTSIASLNLSQTWNAVSYPIVLEAQQGSLYGNAASDFVLKTSYFSGGVNTVQRMRVTDSGVFQISGSLNVSANNIKVDSGYGIDFSATSNGSGTTSSELLNDYEEGTWTPVIRGSSTTGTYTLTGSTAYYTKIGNQVTIYGNAAFSAASGGTGYMEIASLPFTYKANTMAVGQFSSQNFDFSAGTVYAVILPTSSGASTNIFVQEIQDNGTSTEGQISGVTTSTSFRFTFTYTV